MQVGCSTDWDQNVHFIYDDFTTYTCTYNQSGQSREIFIDFVDDTSSFIIDSFDIFFVID